MIKKNIKLGHARGTTGPYIHHVTAIHDHGAYALYKATKFIHDLKPDPVQPSEEEIKSYLRENSS